MPLALPSASRMSRMLALRKLRRSGSREAGFSSGSAADGARALAQLLDRRPRALGLDPRANRLIERDHLRAGLTVRRIVLGGQLVLAARGLELPLLLERLRLVEVRARRRQLRALERDLVVRVVGVSLRRRSGSTPPPGPGRRLSTRRCPCGTPLPRRIPPRRRSRRRSPPAASDVLSHAPPTGVALHDVRASHACDPAQKCVATCMSS